MPIENIESLRIVQTTDEGGADPADHGQISVLPRLATARTSSAADFPIEGIAVTGPAMLTIKAYATARALGSVAITDISVANPTVVTTAADHGLTTGDQVIITGSDSTPSINGLRQVVVLSATTFSVGVDVTVAGTTGTVWAPKIGNPDGAGYGRAAMFKIDAAGAMTQVETTEDLYTKEDAAGWDFKLQVVADNAVVYVKGAASTYIDWIVDYECTIYSALKAEQVT